MQCGAPATARVRVRRSRVLRVDRPVRGRRAARRRRPRRGCPLHAPRRPTRAAARLGGPGPAQHRALALVRPPAGRRRRGTGPATRRDRSLAGALDGAAVDAPLPFDNAPAPTPRVETAARTAGDGGRGRDEIDALLAAPTSPLLSRAFNQARGNPALGNPAGGDPSPGERPPRRSAPSEPTAPVTERRSRRRSRRPTGPARSRRGRARTAARPGTSACSSASARVDQPVAVELREALVERLHPVQVAARHLLRDLAQSRASTIRSRDPGVDHEHLDRGHPAAASGTRHQPLRHDARAARSPSTGAPGAGGAARTSRRGGRSCRSRSPSTARRARGDRPRQPAAPPTRRRRRGDGSPSRRRGPGGARARGPRARSAVSLPTSRWSTIARLSACNTSIGSSIVTMWHSRPAFTWSTIAASVAVFPEPAEPGDQHEPVVLLGERRGPPAAATSASKPGTPGSTRRSTRPVHPRCAERAHAGSGRARRSRTCSPPRRPRRARRRSRAGITADASRSVSAGSTVSNGRLAQAPVDAEARAGADLHVDVGCALFHGEPQQLVEVEHDDSPALGTAGPFRIDTPAVVL